MRPASSSASSSRSSSRAWREMRRPAAGRASGSAATRPCPVAASVERQRRQVGVQDLGRRGTAPGPPAPPRSTGDRHTPGACRPARPRALVGAGPRNPHRLQPRHARCAARSAARAHSPLSTTTRTPSMVRLVSAIEVARTTLRRPRPIRRAGAGPAASGVRSPYSGARSRLSRAREQLLDPADLAGAGQEHQHIAGIVAPARRRWRAPRAPSIRPSAGPGA